MDRRTACSTATARVRPGPTSSKTSMWSAFRTPDWSGKPDHWAVPYSHGTRGQALGSHWRRRDVGRAAAGHRRMGGDRAQELVRVLPGLRPATGGRRAALQRAPGHRRGRGFRRDWRRPARGRGLGEPGGDGHRTPRVRRVHVAPRRVSRDPSVRCAHRRRERPQRRDAHERTCAGGGVRVGAARRPASRSRTHQSPEPPPCRIRNQLPAMALRCRNSAIARATGSGRWTCRR